jgi:hypothetical protein
MGVNIASIHGSAGEDGKVVLPHLHQTNEILLSYFRRIFSFEFNKYIKH